MRAVALVALASAVAGACATREMPAATGPLVASRSTGSADIDVDVDVLPDAAGLVGGVSLRLCARGPWPRRVVPENRRARAFLVSAVDDHGHALPLDADGVRTKDLAGCARIVIDIGRLADAVADKDLALRAGDDLIITPDLWLWRPEPLNDARLFVKVNAAPFDALMPWSTREGDVEHGRLIVDRSTFALKSDSVFGRFKVSHLDAAGARFDVAWLDDGRAPAQLESWLASSAAAVGTLLGHYPVPHVNVLIVPTHVTRPIVVAFFSRGGGPTATIFVGEGAIGEGGIDPDDLDATGRWALTHELSHALLPPVQPQDAWLNEGLATWHQELLARRGGLILDDTAYWSEVVRGLATGKARAATDGLSVAEASRRMHQTGAYQHAYWAGVGVMLLAELAAQRRGASIDDLVRALRAAIPRDDRPRSAAELLAVPRDGKARIAADALTETFAAERDRPFPNVDPALAALGIIVNERGEVTKLDDTAVAASIRRAIADGAKQDAAGATRTTSSAQR